MRSWSAGLAAFVLTGCLGGDGAPAAMEEGGWMEAEPLDPWGGSTRQVLLDLSGESVQLDVVCLFGGGVEMPRSSGRVLPGSGHVEARVAAPSTSTGAQLGYVLTLDPGYDERLQDGITWLEPVMNGERLFTIPVREDQFEEPDGPPLWHFYLRMNVPTGENQPKAPCYTGIHYGDLELSAEAVKA